MDAGDLRAFATSARRTTSHAEAIMINAEPFLEVLTRFSRTLAGRYDVSDVLYELSDSVVAILGTAGAGVSLGDEQGRLRFATATNEAVSRAEQVQQDIGQGPCHQAYESNAPVF